MIKTTKEVMYDIRNQKSAEIFVKMSFPQIVMHNNMYEAEIIDFIVKDGQELAIGMKVFEVAIDLFDNLLNQIKTALNLQGNSIEVMKQAMPHALLQYVKSDVLTTGKLIYGTVADDWELA